MKSGGGGCPLQARYGKCACVCVWGGGVVHFKLHMKSGGGGCPLQAPYEKWGGGEGGLSTSGSI